MLNKLDMMANKAYVKGTMFVKDLKKKGKEFLCDERGLSGVVVAVMLILIAVLLIAAMWGSLSEWLKELWEKVTATDDTMTTQQWS